VLDVLELPQAASISVASAEAQTAAGRMLPSKAHNLH
jgi:hypothetical protein